MSKKNALGRGLDALITFDDLDTQGSSSINEIELYKISPNPDQPRTVFDEESLEELAASISKIGVIQPVTLRQLDDDSYQIIAGLDSIPAYIKSVDEDSVMEMALIENIQREDLNSIEIALAYQNLINSLVLTQEQLSERVGKKRATITNYLRLLKLPAEVQMGVKDKKIDMGHARSLVALNDPVAQISLYNLILEKGMSVREVEAIVREVNDGKSLEELISKKPPKKNSSATATKDGELAKLEKHLSDYFKTKVQFSCNNKGKGKITIPFSSIEQMERIIEMFEKN